MKRILFVCTGNICRSPSAEAVFRHLVEQEGKGKQFLIDSAGTHGYHVGESPDMRAIATAGIYGISMQGISARKVSLIDFEKFDYMIAMDNGHYEFLTRMRPAKAKADILLFMNFSKTQKGIDVPDPYYGTDEEFETVLNMLKEGSIGILESLI